MVNMSEGLQRELSSPQTISSPPLGKYMYKDVFQDEGKFPWFPLGYI